MKRKILIVDDSLEWLSSHSTLIKKVYPELFELDFCKSAAEAILNLRESQPELVITDLEMEKVENKLYAGELLIENVQEFYPEAKILIVSAAYDIDKIAQKYNVEFASKVPFDQYLYKMQKKIAEIFQLDVEFC